MYEKSLKCKCTLSNCPLQEGNFVGNIPHEVSESFKRWRKSQMGNISIFFSFLFFLFFFFVIESRCTVFSEMFSEMKETF